MPSIPDCVYIAVSRDSTVKVIKDFASLGTGGAVCLASRFSETKSKKGLIKTKELLKNSGEMPFLGPNCYGFINYLDRVSVWSDQIAGNETKNGIVLISQSGTIGNTISFNHRSLPIGYIISVGNQTCLTIEDVIEYVLKDKSWTINYHNTYKNYLTHIKLNNSSNITEEHINTCNICKRKFNNIDIVFNMDNIFVHFTCLFSLLIQK